MKTKNKYDTWVIKSEDPISDELFKRVKEKNRGIVAWATGHEINEAERLRGILMKHDICEECGETMMNCECGEEPQDNHACELNRLMDETCGVCGKKIKNSNEKNVD